MPEVGDTYRVENPNHTETKGEVFKLVEVVDTTGSRENVYLVEYENGGQSRKTESELEKDHYKSTPTDIS